MRVIELAQDLRVNSAALLQLLREMGIPVTDEQATVTDGQVATVLARVERERRAGHKDPAAAVTAALEEAQAGPRRRRRRRAVEPPEPTPESAESDAESEPEAEETDEPGVELEEEQAEIERTADLAPEAELAAAPPPGATGEAEAGDDETSLSDSLPSAEPAEPSDEVGPPEDEPDASPGGQPAAVAGDSDPGTESGLEYEDDTLGPSSLEEEAGQDELALDADESAGSTDTPAEAGVSASALQPARSGAPDVPVRVLRKKPSPAASAGPGGSVRIQAEGYTADGRRKKDKKKGKKRQRVDQDAVQSNIQRVMAELKGGGGKKRSTAARSSPPRVPNPSAG